MLRRDFIKSLSAVPFIPSLDWNTKNEYFKYYFGGYGTGKTTRLVNDSVHWLMMNPGTNGLFVVNHFHQIRCAFNCINKPIKGVYNKSDRTLTLPNKSSLRFTSQDLISSDLYCNYQGLWTDQITTKNREFLMDSSRVPFYVQHVISMDEAHDLNDRLGLEPVLISNSNPHIEGSGKLWGSK